MWQFSSEAEEEKSHFLGKIRSDKSKTDVWRCRSEQKLRAGQAKPHRAGEERVCSMSHVSSNKDKQSEQNGSSGQDQVK